MNRKAGGRVAGLRALFTKARSSTKHVSELPASLQLSESPSQLKTTMLLFNRSKLYDQTGGSGLVSFEELQVSKAWSGSSAFLPQVLNNGSSFNRGGLHHKRLNFIEAACSRAVNGERQPPCLPQPLTKLWADSVRRKRKHKMNKHKHRKRLKKLRHRS